jgi:pimeloyl-ACP methyl ester carboxylesterase
MGPDAKLNPLDPAAFAIHRTTVRDGVELAYVREGEGGVPLLMIHGWPGTKRIFYRNIGPLSEMGFEVIAPDTRGWGDSPVPTDPSRYADAPRAARDFKELMEQLGHRRWVTVSFDYGSVTAQDMSNRFPDQVIRQVLWNSAEPYLPDEYEAAGVGGDQMEEILAVTDHPVEHGEDTDAFVAQFKTPEERREYVMSFYQGRVWKEGDRVRGLAGMGLFDDETAAFHAEPFEDEAVFRSSLNVYTAMRHPDQCSEEPMLAQKSLTETLLLYGVDDEIVSRMLTKRGEIGYANLTGPFLVEGGGHFLCWERPSVLNSAITCFCRDLLAER